MQKAKSKKFMFMEKITIKPVWFDSLGAKSSCMLVKTPDVKILIDPGIAAMQPSFPAPVAGCKEARRNILTHWLIYR